MMKEEDGNRAIIIVGAVHSLTVVVDLPEN